MVYLCPSTRSLWTSQAIVSLSTLFLLKVSEPHRFVPPLSALSVRLSVDAEVSRLWSYVADTLGRVAVDGSPGACDLTAGAAAYAVPPNSGAVARMVPVTTVAANERRRSRPVICVISVLCRASKSHRDSLPVLDGPTTIAAGGYDPPR